MNTKTKIFNASVMLFSERGYSKVSVRDIASEVDIKVSSIYNHYVSKADILKTLYDYYLDGLNKIKPSVESLLDAALNLSVYQALAKLDYQFESNERETMHKILSIACMEFRSDSLSARFIRESVFTPVYELLAPLLKRLIELDKIEPIDIDIFAELTFYVSFGAAVCNHTVFHPNYKKWQKVLGMLMSQVKIKE